jgi:hypothetical protein
MYQSKLINAMITTMFNFYLFLIYVCSRPQRPLIDIQLVLKSFSVSLALAMLGKTREGGREGRESKGKGEERRNGERERKGREDRGVSPQTQKPNSAYV